MNPSEAQLIEGSTWLRNLYDLFQPVREEAAQFSDEEINAAIDAAVTAVRKQRLNKPAKPCPGPG